MARKPEIAELPTKVLMTELGSGKRYKKIVVFGGIGVGLLGGGVFIAARTIDANNIAARDAAYSSLSVCLFGDPLKDGESPAARVAASQLAVVGVPGEKRTKPGEVPWPGSCEKPAFQLAEHAGSDALADAAKELGKAVKADTGATADLRAPIEKFMAAATAAKLKAGPATDVAPAPKPAAPLFSGEAFASLPKFLSGGFVLSNIQPEPMPGNKVHFLIDQKDTPEGPVLCVAGAADAVIKCQKVPADVATLSPGLRLLGANESSARPFYFAGDRGQLGIFPPEGKKAVAASVAFGAVARGDGSVTFTTRKDGSKELRIVFQPPTGFASDQSLLQPTDYESPLLTALFPDWFVYKSQKPAHLFAKKIEGTTLKPNADLGELDEAAPLDYKGTEQLISGCKTEEALSIRVRGQRADTFAFYAAGRWAGPVKATTHGGALTCHGVEAVSTMVEHVADRDKDYPNITQARCNPSGCTPINVNMKTLLAGVPDVAPADASSSVVADHAGKMLLVWNGGYTGGLRMRLAPADRLGATEDVIITEGRGTKGDAKISTIAQMRLVSAATFQLLFLNTTDAGIKVLRIEQDGKLTPLSGSI